MSTHDWEIVLLLDSREQRTRVDRSYFHDRILERNVPCEIRSLPLGDMMWILRRKLRRQKGRPSSLATAAIHEEDEIVLHFIVERKRMDDLAASFIDGRYKEQKFRLQHCGLRNIVYLVEGEISHQDRMSSKQLESAIVETEIHEGFRTYRTKHAGETVEFLCHLHHQIVAMTLPGARSQQPEIPPCISHMALKEFRQRSSKSSRCSTARDVFGRILRQLPRCGGPQANAILQRYPTLAHLVKAYQDAESESDAISLLENIRPSGRSRLGPSLSRMAYFLFHGKAYA